MKPHHVEAAAVATLDDGVQIELAVAPPRQLVASLMAPHPDVAAVIRAKLENDLVFEVGREHAIEVRRDGRVLEAVFPARFVEPDLKNPEARHCLLSAAHASLVAVRARALRHAYGDLYVHHCRLRRAARTCS